MPIIIKEVQSKKELCAFIKFPFKLYKHSKYYVPPLISKEMKTLDKRKNPAFEFCEARYWMAFRDNVIVGRIAGIFNYAINKKYDKTFIRFGWFDFIEDQDVVNALLFEVEKWGIEKNAEMVNGPLGFISFDPTGVLVEGFDEIPTSYATYNYPYYDKLIKNYGYVKDADWIEFNIKVPERMPEKILKVSALIKERYKLRNLEFTTKNEALKYTDLLFNLLNDIYGDLPGYIKLTPAVKDNIMKELNSLFLPDYLSIIINEKDEPVAFGIVTPSISGALQKARGKLFPLGLFYILKAIKSHKVADLLLIGVRPDYQNKGVHSIIFEKNLQSLINHKVKEVEVTRTLENNSKLTNIWGPYEYRQHKRARCYVKQLNYSV
ncbi:MAG: hypothetical protein BWY27_00739 [Bacteroidetes bacterium ADurb.Bin234]|nr:MAG: hypothetical protein BWY27_00739 [Bacteroidetes bacterium ADurb.Bin234]